MLFSAPPMTSHRTDAERRLHELLETAARADASEDDIKRRVANLIEVLADDQTARQEVQTSTGIIDILVGNVIIEAKIDANRLEPAPSWARGDVNIRRQYAASQLQDYVNERYRGIKSETSVFDGYTTNGTTWHRWAVTVGGEVPELVWTKDLTQSTLDAAVQSGIDRASIIDDLFNDITSTLASRPPPPDDLQQLLSDLPDAAYRRAREMLGQPDFETKRNLWRDLMRGAFVLTPGETESDIRLFATHSILVEIARTVADDVLTPGTFLGERNGSSFSAWVNAPISDRTDDDHGAYSSNTGSPLSARIAREVGRYNWRLASSDILKGVYHDFIPTDVRHDFGEYYTPDWLAEAMCEEILDDDWCRASIQRAADPSDDLQGCGMLEPSCGSGTFLRAAVRRLIPFAESLTDDRVEQADMICRLLYAFDIHPVAVELAKSTMLSALPDTPSNGMSAINVYLADSLRWVEDTGMRLMSVGGILINVPAIGDYPSFDVVVPSEIVQHPEFADVVADIFMFRDNIRILRERLRSLGFSQETIHGAIELAESMKTLSAQGRNDVWQWYITNVAQANRLHARGFDRILGNPPWITRKDMTPDRQARHRAQSLELGVWKGGASLATQNNLAALFVAKVTRDYATDGTDWKVGFVQIHQDNLNDLRIRDGQVRAPDRVELLLAMYYPQDVASNMGPTVVLPGTHMLKAMPDRMASQGNFKDQYTATVDAGSVVILHYDVWHAGSANTSETVRYMLKFLFQRANLPDVPSWNHDSANDTNIRQRLESESPMALQRSLNAKQRHMRLRMWNYLSGAETLDMAYHDKWRGPWR